jgi:sugar lactone lactonase YvrE
MLRYAICFLIFLISTSIHAQVLSTGIPTTNYEPPLACEYFLAEKGTNWGAISRLNIETGEITKRYYLPFSNYAEGIGAKEGKLYMTSVWGLRDVFLNSNNGINSVHFVNVFPSDASHKMVDSGFFRESGGEFVASGNWTQRQPIFGRAAGTNILTTPFPFPYQLNGVGFLDLAEQLYGNNMATFGVFYSTGPGTSLVRYDTMYSSPVLVKTYPNLRFTGLAINGSQLIAVTDPGDLYSINPINGNERFLRRVQSPEGTRAFDLATSCTVLEQPKACEFFVAEKGTTHSSISRYNPSTGELIKRYLLPQMNGQKIIPNGIGADKDGRLMITYPNMNNGPLDTLLRPNGTAMVNPYAYLNNLSSANRPSDGGHFHDGKYFSVGGTFNYGGATLARQLIRSNFINGKIENVMTPAVLSDVEGQGFSDVVVRKNQSGANHIFGWLPSDDNGAYLYRYDLDMTNPIQVAHYPELDSNSADKRISGLANRADGRIWAVTVSGNLKIVNPENGEIENSGVVLQNPNGEVLDLATTNCDNASELQGGGLSSAFLEGSFSDSFNSLKSSSEKK